jgi:hypothetical protein
MNSFSVLLTRKKTTSIAMRPNLMNGALSNSTCVSGGPWRLTRCFTISTWRRFTEFLQSPGRKLPDFADVL